MGKHLLLAATLGAFAILPAPASAHGHGPVHPNVVSSFGVRIIVRDGPKVVHHHHPPRRHLKPQPWPHTFKHHAPGPRWHQLRHHQTRHFRLRDADRRHHFKHGHPRGWLHAPVRNPAPHTAFKQRDRRSGSHRHR